MISLASPVAFLCHCFSFSLEFVTRFLQKSADRLAKTSTAMLSGPQGFAVDTKWREREEWGVSGVAVANGNMRSNQERSKGRTPAAAAAAASTRLLVRRRQLIGYAFPTARGREKVTAGEWGCTRDRHLFPVPVILSLASHSPSFPHLRIVEQRLTMTGSTVSLMMCADPW